MIVINISLVCTLIYLSIIPQLYYNLTPVELRSKCLQLTVWDASSILSKECLGCVLIELQPLYNKLIKGFVSWFDLQPAALINR